MLITKKDSTEQLFLDRRKHIKRTLDVTVTQGDITFKVPIDRILKDSFKYQEQGTSNTEKIFGFCSNPMIEISLYNIELKQSDLIDISFVLENESDDTANDKIELGSFTVHTVKKNSATKIYQYVAYNFIVTECYPTKFDIWRLSNCPTNTGLYSYEMSFGILNAKCGIRQYLGEYRNTSLNFTNKTHFLTDLDDGRLALLNYDILYDVGRGFIDSNKIYKVYKSALVKHPNYQQALNIITTHGVEIINFIDFSGIYTFVAGMQYMDEILSSYPLFYGNINEEELFLMHDDPFDTRIYICIPREILIWNPSTQTYETYGIYTEASRNFVKVAEGHSSENHVGAEYNKPIFRIVPDSDFDNDDYAGYRVVSEQTAKTLDFSAYLDKAYELLGKRAKPAKNIPNKKVTEGEDVNIKTITTRIYPESVLYPGMDYPHRMSNNIYQYSSHQDVLYSPEDCDTLEYDPEVYQYSGIRFNDGFYERTLFFDEETQNAPYHIYDLTNNDLLSNFKIEESIRDLLNIGLIPKLKEMKVSNVEISAPANVITELYDTIVFKDYYDGATKEYTSPIYSRTLKGEQFVFEEIESKHGDVNKKEEEWKNDKYIFIGGI